MRLEDRMATTQIGVNDGGEFFSSSSLAETFDRPEWYAVYTNARHEKRVTEYLGGRSLECYLPSYRSVRRWQDRQKEVGTAFISGLCFRTNSLPLALASAHRARCRADRKLRRKAGVDQRSGD